MLDVQLDGGPGPGVESGPPALGLGDRLGRHPDAPLLHEQHEIILRRDIAVQRHGREAELARDRGHRDSPQAAGVGEFDGHVDDPLDAHLTLRPALRVRRDAPGQRDATREVGFRVLALHVDIVAQTVYH
jgi:hypothetical protein